MSVNPLVAVTDRIEQLPVLDPPARAVAGAIRAVTSPRALKATLNGSWIGHALHPLLTDVVIGSFLSATILDVLGGDRDGTARRRLIGVGIAAYPPTALTGASDWSDVQAGDAGMRRVGLVHAVTNASALALYSASLVARRNGRRGRGVVLGLGGAAALGAAGYLGAHLSYVKGAGVERGTTGAGPLGPA